MTIHENPVRDAPRPAPKASAPRARPRNSDSRMSITPELSLSADAGCARICFKRPTFVEGGASSFDPFWTHCQSPMKIKMQPPK